MEERFKDMTSYDNQGSGEAPEKYSGLVPLY